ncbi:unnamed protein product [Coccothraustes coccothraustes]
MRSATGLLGNSNQSGRRAAGNGARQLHRGIPSAGLRLRTLGMLFGGASADLGLWLGFRTCRISLGSRRGKCGLAGNPPAERHLFICQGNFCPLLSLPHLRKHGLVLVPRNYGENSFLSIRFKDKTERSLSSALLHTSLKSVCIAWCQTQS